jgi:hypothetical protein
MNAKNYLLFAVIQRCITSQSDKRGDRVDLQQRIAKFIQPEHRAGETL